MNPTTTPQLYSREQFESMHLNKRYAVIQATFNYVVEQAMKISPLEAIAVHVAHGEKANAWEQQDSLQRWLEAHQPAGAK